MSELITSAQNPRVKLVRRLRDKRDREREGRFVVDGLRDFERALACGLVLDFVLVCPELLREPLPELPAGRVVRVTAEVMDKAGYRENPEGVVAVMVMPPALGADALVAEAGEHRGADADGGCSGLSQCFLD
jgi:RNA methyltransferase, TrmH family